MNGGREQGGSAQEPARPIAIDDLDLSLVGRVRATVCAEAVEDYAGNLEALPPVRVADVAGQLVLVGGLHRLRAAERDGRAAVTALVEPMDWVSAVHAAAGDNRRHGVRLTAADRRAAAGLLLEECPEMSDRAVADIVGCSHPTIAAVRQAQAPAADRLAVPVAPEGPKPDGPQVVKFTTSHDGSPLARAAPRRGRDGKAYRVTARSGSRAGQTPEEPGAASRQPTGLDDAPKLSPALLVDYRSKAEWVARYLRCVLDPAGREHRREALDIVLAGLTPEELRMLAERIAAALGGGHDRSPGGLSRPAPAMPSGWLPDPKLQSLPYREIWALDFEFQAPAGERPAPVCLVAVELRTGRLLGLWQDELPSRPPFRTDAEALFVAYYASAELGCFLDLGWPMPARILDLFAEFRAATNGLPTPCGSGLLGALAWHGLDAMAAGAKGAMRDLVLRGGPWSSEERRAVLDYCEADVDALAALLPSMLPSILARQRDPSVALGQALLRGRYMAAAARMERTGVPIDTDMLARLRGGWGGIKTGLVAEVDRAYGVYEGTRFRTDRFVAYLAREGIPWPCTEAGRLKLDDGTFRDMAKSHPRLQPLRELRHALGELRLEALAVGADGRNRTLLSAFRSRTGRNQPSNTKFIFGPATWLRSLIRPELGTALAYVDFSSQEMGIAAALSGDPALLDAYRSGDVYLSFAKQAGLAPADATKASHGEVRDRCKAVVLGTLYGMGPETLARRIGRPPCEAKELLRLHRATYPRFWRWSEAAVTSFELTRRIETVFGWPLHAAPEWNPRSVMNFPMQANGAEMLRLACCLATERGLAVCAPVHDAILIEAPAAEVGGHVAALQACMREASRVVLGGLVSIGVQV